MPVEVTVVIIDSDRARRRQVFDAARRGIGNGVVESGTATLPSVVCAGQRQKSNIVCIIHNTDIDDLPAREQRNVEAVRKDIVALSTGSPAVLIRHTRTWNGFDHLVVGKFGRLTDIECGSDALEENLESFLEACKPGSDLEGPPVDILRRPPVKDAASALACLCLGFLAVRAAEGDGEAEAALELDDGGLGRLKASLEDRRDQCRDEVNRREWWNPVARDAADKEAFEKELTLELRRGGLPAAIQTLLNALDEGAATRGFSPPNVSTVAEAYQVLRGALSVGR